jgi:GNAT superfamily N-acetyltransferase
MPYPIEGQAMQIRNAHANDQDALAQIRREAILALAGRTLSLEQAAHWANSAAADRCVRAIREHVVWVAIDGAPIGWVEVDQDRIAALYVAPAWARRGVGLALLAYAESAIRNAGYAVARLEASPNALGYYLPRGYMRDGLPDATGAYPLRKTLTAVD